MGNKQFAPGQIVRVIDDGQFKAGHGAKFIRAPLPWICEVYIRGVVYWIQDERIGGIYGE